MRNLTNTLVAWTPADRSGFDTAGKVALVDHPWPHQWGPFPYAKDFGAGLGHVVHASLDERMAMLASLIRTIVSDGIPLQRVYDAISPLQEFTGESP